MEGAGQQVPAIIDSLLRAGEGKTLRKLKAIVSQVNSIEDDFRSMTDAELRAMTDELKQRHADGQTLDELMPEAFATVREAATRVLGQRHFDGQLMGGAALHFGNMAWGMEECVQRGDSFGIVDEVDSILIDEARTPLIISGPVDQNSIWYQTFARIAPRLRRGEDGEGDYEVDEKKRTIGISEAGVAHVEGELGIDNLY